MPKIDRYEIVSRIARGGMAEVFLAWFEEKGRRVPVALKRILPEAAEDKDVIVMLLDEARISARLQHPGIARMYDLGKVAATYFLVIEFVDGRELRALLDETQTRGEKVPPLVLAYAVQQAALALDYAHRLLDDKGRPMGIVHRDISPANLMVRYDGFTKVIDFGIARAQNRMTRTSTGMIKGKFRYMAPEQAMGNAVDYRADLYSLGVVLYEGLAGHMILPKTLEPRVVIEVIEGKVPTLSKAGVKVAPELERIVTRAMALEPGQRPASGAELARDLAAFVAANGGEKKAIAETQALLARLFPEGPGSLARLLAR